MQSGPKEHPVYFQYPVETNDSGVLRKSWVNASTDSPPAPDWAYIISQRGNEAFESARTNARETIRCCLNFRADVKTTWRMEWDGQFYELIHVDRSKARAGELWITGRLLGAE